MKIARKMMNSASSWCSCSRPAHFSSQLLFLSFIIIISILLVEMQQPAVAQNRTTAMLIPVNIGVVLDLDAWLGKMGLSCINMALSDFYATHPHYTTRLILNPRDSNSDVVRAAAAALDLIKNAQVQAILGPATSMEANFVIDLGEKAHVPILSFSATSPSLTSLQSPYFFRATQNDSAQVNAISAIVRAFDWREAVPIYVNNEFGEGIIPFLTDALQAVDARVPYRSVIPPSATDDQISEELYKLMTMQTRVFIVHMPPSLGSRLFTKAKEIGMMSQGYAWIMTDAMTDLFTSTPTAAAASASLDLHDSMQGVLGVKSYLPKTKELANFRTRWKRKFQQDNPDIIDAQLNIFGLWGYDAATALAMAIEKTAAAAAAGVTNLGFQKANVTGISNWTDLDAIGVSLNGPNLIQALSNTSFKGLTGHFAFVEGQLQSTAFQIVNVNGDGLRGIGFWTPREGLVRNLKKSSITLSLSSNATNTSSTYYSTSRTSLASVIWPGDSTSVPKGWQVPTNGKMLRIGVPVKDGFSEFVKVTRDASMNTNVVTGYCIDVFDAVANALPYSLDYEYVPFAKPDGTTAGTYDDLVYQVYLGNFDAVVGDTTIVANRSLYVDFTLPYTESGVSMIVPVTDNNSKNAWVFLKPLTWDLWVTSFCFFLFIGFVIWVLEHRINEDFRGPPSHQAGTGLWFSFSTMVFAHREKVISNLGRVVVIVWCFVVLLLTQSYTASLASLLTVQQLQPTVTDVNVLIKKGEYVGYQEGSFVLGILKRLGFEEKKLLVYNSTEECDELFSKGSGNGGIAAAFDEVPYMKLFLSQYCSKYTMIEPTFKTDGFGFAFPRDSPLVADVSRAVLKVTEGEKMREIENARFGKQRTCPDSSTSVSSNSLDLNSFWGLFLIAGIASVSALLIFTVMFVFEHRKELIKPSDTKASMWSRFLNLIRTFDQKDFKSFTFRRGELNSTSAVNLPSMGDPSPSTYSVRTDFPVDQGTPSGYHDAGHVEEDILRERVQTFMERGMHIGIGKPNHDGEREIQSDETAEENNSNHLVV